MKVVKTSVSNKKDTIVPLNPFPWRRDDYFHHHNVAIMIDLHKNNVPVERVIELYNKSGITLTVEDIKTHVKLADIGAIKIYKHWVIPILGLYYNLTNPIVNKFFTKSEIDKKRESKEHLRRTFNRILKW